MLTFSFAGIFSGHVDSSADAQHLNRKCTGEPQKIAEASDSDGSDAVDVMDEESTIGCGFEDIGIEIICIIVSE